MDSDHPMPYPFHVHGAGRFHVLARDCGVEPDLVWKDTVLVASRIAAVIALGFGLLQLDRLFRRSR
jgi:FtsP/CotA-like multicopper oxidase with cupredoxin domain